MNLIVKGFGNNNSLIVKGFGGLATAVYVKVIYAFSLVSKVLELRSVKH